MTVYTERGAKKVVSTEINLGSMQYVGGNEVVGSAATTLTVSGLDLDAHERYFVEIAIDNATGSTSNISVYFNSDTTAANYDRESAADDGSTQGAARANNSEFVQLTANEQYTGHGWLTRTVEDKPALVQNGTRNATTAIELHRSAVQWRTTATNVTEITLSASVASSLAVGTKMRVFKIVSSAPGTVINSENIAYNNAASGLEATNVQDAIDEIVGTAQYKYCQADLPKASDTALADDDTLFCTLAANSCYLIEIDVWFDSSATPDLKYDINFTGTVTSYLQSHLQWNGATASLPTGISTGSFGGVLASAINVVHSFNFSSTATMFKRVTVQIETGASGGTLSYRWAQATSSGTAVTRRRNSTLRCTKMA